MLDVVTPLSIVSSQLSASKGTAALPSSEKSDSFSMDFEEDMGMNSNSLSSTLQKLYIWEKKLCEEVKVCCIILNHICGFLCTSIFFSPLKVNMITMKLFHGSSVHFTEF